MRFGFTHTHIYIYIYTCACLCICICSCLYIYACAWVSWKEKAKNSLEWQARHCATDLAQPPVSLWIRIRAAFRYLHTCIYIYIYVYIHTHTQTLKTLGPSHTRLPSSCVHVSNVHSILSPEFALWRNPLQAIDSLMIPCKHAQASMAVVLLGPLPPHPLMMMVIIIDH